MFYRIWRIWRGSCLDQKLEFRLGNETLREPGQVWRCLGPLIRALLSFVSHLEEPRISGM